MRYSLRDILLDLKYSSNARLNESAMQLAEKYKFSPPEKNGVKVKS